MGYKVIEIPKDTYCESCEEAEATTYHDHDGWIPPTFTAKTAKTELKPHTKVLRLWMSMNQSLWMNTAGSTNEGLTRQSHRLFYGWRGVNYLGCPYSWSSDSVHTFS